jgi:hypothetical protein
MANQASAKCLVCGDLAGQPVRADQKLICSKTPIAEFIVRHNVVRFLPKNERDLSRGQLCVLCYDEIENCDEFMYIVAKTLAKLRQRAANNLGRESAITARLTSSSTVEFKRQPEESAITARLTSSSIEYHDHRQPDEGQV